MQQQEMMQIGVEAMSKQPDGNGADTSLGLSDITERKRMQGEIADCVITGIRPEIAQTMIHLGLDMESFPTRRNLQDGLAYALKKLGYEVKRNENIDARR